MMAASLSSNQYGRKGL